MDIDDMALKPRLGGSPGPIYLPDHDNVKSLSKHGFLQKLNSLFRRQDHLPSPIFSPHASEDMAEQQPERRARSTRPVGVGLPRQATYRRQNSERRECLFPVQTCPAERRAMSMSGPKPIRLSRPRTRSSPPRSSSPPSENPATHSAPAVTQSYGQDEPPRPERTVTEPPERSACAHDNDFLFEGDHSRSPRPLSPTSSDDFDRNQLSDAEHHDQLNAELDSKWILNLSMHFRDKSDREKFFVTYAETPNKWRRVTVSCDYRNAELGSLEMDLKELQYQRDKSLQIYDSIRESLPDIQFYDTVTNLKLQTSDGRLHVHVTEDVNEIIPYPPKAAASYILRDREFAPREVRECELAFDSHLSGFVYKVTNCGKTYIKKEIPGPDTVDEFLYEMNALHSLRQSECVIQLEAIVVDDLRQNVKGLLISYAERGALVDLLYDFRGKTRWDDRMRWARQAVRGLSEIHGEGYVQGDFTLSNIVVDAEENAKIIDINRRGCPVGWEPPELAEKIASNQRISMYIGEKSDLYQLGMTLWALAMDDDEPERHDQPLSVMAFPSEVPEWYRDIIRICLSPRPRDRMPAKELLKMFPAADGQSHSHLETRPSLSARTEKQYIDPATAVERDDIERYGTCSRQSQEDMLDTPASSRDDPTFTYPRSSNCEVESGSSYAYVEMPRGRPPPSDSRPLNEETYLYSGADSAGVEVQAQIVSIAPGRRGNVEDPSADCHPNLVSTNDSEMTNSQTEQPADRHPEPGTSRHETTNLEPGAYPAELAVVESNVETTYDEIELDPPILPSAHSSVSDLTPRTSQTALVVLPENTPQPLSIDLASPDLVGLGAHPDLEQHSPHEPRTALTSPVIELSSSGHEFPLEAPTDSEKNLEPSQATLTTEPPTPAIASLPPRLPFLDSGYDEPALLADLHDQPAEGLK